MNRRLIQQCADAVIRYLVENLNVPLYNIITPYGWSEGGLLVYRTLIKSSHEYKVQHRLEFARRTT